MTVTDECSSSDSTKIRNSTDAQWVLVGLAQATGGSDSQDDCGVIGGTYTESHYGSAALGAAKWTFNYNYCFSVYTHPTWTPTFPLDVNWEDPPSGAPTNYKSSSSSCSGAGNGNGCFQYPIVNSEMYIWTCI